MYTCTTSFSTLNSRLDDIDNGTLQSPEKCNPTNSEDAHMKHDSDEDSVFDSSDDENNYHDVEDSKKLKIDKFWDMLVRLFENNILPYSESHYPQYWFLYVWSINQVFLQKLITLFIFKAFSNKNSEKSKSFKSDNITSQIWVNYICSLLATTGKEIIPVNIFFDSIRFLVKYFKGRFHSKRAEAEQIETFSSNSEGNRSRQKTAKKNIKVEDKLFYINVIQGLSYILCYKIPEIESQDPTLLIKILKLILNNEYKAVLFNQTTLLSTLLSSLKQNRVQK